MSILIKGIEMPQSCMNCMFCGFAGANCELDFCQITGNAQKHIPHSKMPDCPLIEVSSDSVQPVKHGRWINICGDSESMRQCSECLQDFDYIDGICYLVSGQRLPLYCPNCGAKMDMDGET